MAGEADTQLDIIPREGMRFFTFTLRDVLGREIPGQMEAPSEEHVRLFLAERGYELVEVREGWYGMKFEQSAVARKAAVDERLREWLGAILQQARRDEAEAVSIALLPAEDTVRVFRLVSGDQQEMSDAPPDIWPALREELAKMAGVELGSYEARREGTVHLDIDGARRDLEVTFEGNTIGLRMPAR